MVPEHYRRLYSAEEIASTVKTLAAPISLWARDAEELTGRDILAIPLLRGGIFFFSDLVRQLSVSVELNPVFASAYAGNAVASAVRVSIEELEVSGRAVLLLDDICDSGRTLGEIAGKILSRGAAEVRTAVLIKRELNGAFEPDWSGFRYSGSEWFVGYGMDDGDRYRNLPEIYLIERG